MLAERTVEECVVDRLSVLERHDPQDSRFDLSVHPDPAPVSNPPVPLYLAPDRSSEHIPAPLAPDVGSLSHHGVEGDRLGEEQPLLAALYAASVGGRIATSRRAGQRVRRLGDPIDVDDLEVLEGERCASVDGVSLHANVAVPARDRRRLG